MSASTDGALRILLYTREFLPYAGGAATYTYDLASGLHDLSQHVTVLAPAYGHADQHIDGQAPFAVVRQSSRDVTPHGEAESLRGFLESRTFDVALICEYRAQESAAVLASSELPPYVITVHGTEIIRHFRPGSDRGDLVRRLFSRAKRIIAVSESTRRVVRQHLPEAAENVEVVHSGVNPAIFPELPPDQIARLREDLGLGHARVLLCASRLAPRKGHDVLLRAFEWIAGTLGDAFLLFAGDGPCMGELRRLAARLGIQARVIFLGAVERSDLHRYLSICDLFVLISRRGVSESFGLVYLEANCCGRPVLAGRTGGVREAVADGVSGILVRPDDPNMVAAAALDLLREPKTLRSLGLRGRRRVLDRFTHRHMAENTLRVFHDGI